MEAGPNVQRAWRVLPGCPDVGLMVIGDDGCRLGLGGRPGAAEVHMTLIGIYEHHLLAMARNQGADHTADCSCAPHYDPRSAYPLAGWPAGLHCW